MIQAYNSCAYDEEICCSNEDMDEDYTELYEKDPYSECGIVCVRNESEWPFYLYWTVRK